MHPRPSRLAVVSLFLVLSAASAGCLALSGLRVHTTGSMEYSFMPWNLALAWVPMGFAACALWAHRARLPFAAALGPVTAASVTSLTFPLIPASRGPGWNLFHIDLYRIDTQRELDTLALDDLRSENSILLIEWGEKFPRFGRERDVEIAIEREDENSRKITISG